MARRPLKKDHLDSNYLAAAIYYRIADGSETSITVNMIGQNSLSYQGSSIMIAVFENCFGIVNSFSEWTDTAEYTSNSIKSSYGSVGDLEICVCCIGYNKTSMPLIFNNISGGDWGLVHMSPESPHWYPNRIAYIQRPVPSSVIDPHEDCIIDTNISIQRLTTSIRMTHN